MRNWKVVGSVAVAVALAAAVYAEQSKPKSLSFQDYMEIQQLYARYAWAIDTRDQNGVTYSKMWTPDGEFLRNGQSLAAGREKLAEMVAKLGTQTGPAHFMSNIMIQPSPEGARGFAYLGPSANGASAYEDVLVRTPEGWRFKQRKLYAGVMPPASPF